MVIYIENGYQDISTTLRLTFLLLNLYMHILHIFIVLM
jgi:hypothetical protein